MIYISLGSNLGNRLDNLWEFVNLIRQYCLSNIRCSIILETKAILPCSASTDWDKPFLNMIVAGETNLSPTELLQLLQNIEITIGRPRKHELWAPRIIDLDILFYNDLIINTDGLVIPHPKLENRDFLKHLLALMGKEPWKFQPNIENSFIKSSVLNPRLVGIVNITKDSFSDGGNFYETNKAIEQVIKLVEDGASVIEIGAQSTRPNATIQPIESEYAKLDEVLEELAPIITDKKIDISVDTLHPLIAVNLIEKYHIRWINDVGGGFDDNTLRAIAKAGCKFCLMHSITIPPSKNQIIPLNVKPIDYLIQWGKGAIQRLTKLGFTLENIVLDPGIGFGKTAYQNIEILRSIDQLKSLGSLIMIGHSRKSYIHAFSEEPHAYARDIETIGASLAIKDKVDFLRVHNVKDHMKALVAYHLSIISNRPLSKLAYAEGFEGDGERRTASYSNVREDSSTASTYKSPAEVEFQKRSNDMISKQSISIIGIMAATKDGVIVIGRNNALPWYYPDEIKHFRAITHNSIVIMGRNTYQSMPKTLFIDRQTFVLSNDNSLQLNGTKVFTSLQKCLEHLKKSKTNDKIFMIGGGQIAHLFLEHNLISSFILTEIHKLYSGDVYLDLRYFRRWTRYTLKKSSSYTIYLLKNPEEVSWNL